jgi:hypothetical protein
LIEISQGFKTFWVYIKDLLEKLFQTFIPLQNSFEEIEFQNTILKLYQTYASLFAKENIYKMFYNKIKFIFPNLGMQIISKIILKILFY